MSVNNAVLSGGADNGAAKPKITSPNIKSIADEHVKFRARDIRPFNLGKLFVKVEGSEERRRAIQRELHQQRKESIKVQKASERSIKLSTKSCKPSSLPTTSKLRRMSSILMLG